MENESISDGHADGRSSLGNYDSYDSFGSAFHTAHSLGGSGHTFTYVKMRETIGNKINQNFASDNTKLKEAYFQEHLQNLLKHKTYIQYIQVEIKLCERG
jgi:hypothetical protein